MNINATLVFLITTYDGERYKIYSYEYIQTAVRSIIIAVVSKP